MRKRTTILTILVATVVLLTGCGDSEKIRALESDVAFLKTAVNDLNQKFQTREDSTSVKEETAVNSSASQEITEAKEEPVSSSESTIIPAEKEAIHVSILHRDDTDKSASTYATADEAGNNAAKLEGNVKTVTFVVSGVTIDRIEVIQSGNFEPQSITFDESGNQYVFENSYTSYGKKTFLVTTKNNKQYYFSATF